MSLSEETVRTFIEKSVALLPDSERDVARQFLLQCIGHYVPCYYRYQSSSLPASDVIPELLLLPMSFAASSIRDLESIYRYVWLSFLCVPEEKDDRWILTRDESVAIYNDPSTMGGHGFTLFLSKADGGVYFQPLPPDCKSSESEPKYIPGIGWMQPASLDSKSSDSVPLPFRVADSFAAMCQTIRDRGNEWIFEQSSDDVEPTFTPEQLDSLRACFQHESFDVAFSLWKAILCNHDYSDMETQESSSDATVYAAVDLFGPQEESRLEHLLHSAFFLQLPFCPFDGERYGYPRDQWLALGSVGNYRGSGIDLEVLLFDRKSGRVACLRDINEWPQWQQYVDTQDEQSRKSFFHVIHDTLCGLWSGFTTHLRQTFFGELRASIVCPLSERLSTVLDTFSERQSFISISQSDISPVRRSP
ncbi:MAG: hypothetical protein Q4G59_10795, partial [Planctomycetia bacterium]|nr:hypothetical protein [Planctomycetia bacterium]